MKKGFLRFVFLSTAALLILTACGAEATPIATAILATETPIPPTFTPTVTPEPTETPIPPTPTVGVGSTMISDKDGMILLYVPAGEFTMGGKAEDALAECQKFRSDCQLNWFKNEEPPHTVDLDAFWIDQTEVTNAMYGKCVADGACNEPIYVSLRNDSLPTDPGYYGNSEYDNYPVVWVDWNMAIAYCEWADRRLPTEAEWEKAARWNPPLPVGEGGGEGEAFEYPWGNSFDGSLVNFCDTNCSFDRADKSSDDGFADVAPVGSYPNGASPYGALDMAGNVWELVSSLYQPYPYSADDSRENFDSSEASVLRGGAWDLIDYELRSARRSLAGPSYTDDDIGFRCAKSQNEQPGSTSLAQVETNVTQSGPTDAPSPSETSIPPTPALDIGSTMTGEDDMTLLYVPAGEFTMGSDDSDQPDERPEHQVDLDAFWIDKTEVTNAMYAKCMDAGMCKLPSDTTHYDDSNYADHPVVYVSWDQATEYCAWADRRLPTEAEWEKAARGENANVYPWGNTFDGSLVNFCDTNCSFINADKSSNDGFADVAPVGSFSDGSGPYGALDMAGNVWEWVNDWYSETYYSSSPSTNPEGANSGQYRVLRGGSWSDVENGVRSAVRYLGYYPSSADNVIGFRCARSADASEQIPTVVISSTPAASLFSTNTPVASSCYDSMFVSDISIPDNTTLLPSQAFTKTWMAKNSGTCDWKADYKLVFGSGDSMSGSSTSIGRIVKPGEVIEISVSLIAPTTSGNATGIWRLKNEQGNFFGAIFSVIINVK